MDVTTSSDSWLAWLTAAMWVFVALAALFYFVGSYLFEILAQKLDEPRWMAWVPLVNLYLMLKLVGWEKWFWVILGGYTLAFLAILLPPPIMFLALLGMIPAGLCVIVIGLAYWPKLATKRDLSGWIGLLMIVPQFVGALVESFYPGAWLVALLATLVAFGAFLAIVFHDGGPKAPPHPIGYALTLFGALLTAGLLHVLPEKLAADPAFQQQLEAFSQQIEARFGESVAQARFGGEPAEELAELLPDTDEPGEPKPYRVASVCPPDTRESGSRASGGRDWWCEIETRRGWVRHGPARTWFPSGQLETEGEYRDGQRSGTWTRYWPSGVRRAQAEFREGRQHGWMHGWDEHGRLEREVFYEDGEPRAASLGAAS